MLEKEPGVLVALPFGDTGKVEVWTSKKGVLTKKSARKIIEFDKDFEVTGFQRRQENAGSR